ncbi:MAG: HD domain-containing protein [Methyloligellaceae bacterium]
MTRLGFAEHRDVYDALRAAYSEAHRFYHTTEHISHCLQQLDDVAERAGSLEDVETALWFHDAVYAPRSQSNERDSAEWASDFLRLAGAGEARCAKVREHIIATEHNAAPTDPDAALVVDIDLTILGSAPEAYQVFETNIRQEYKWVPAPLYRRKRKEVLGSFLARPSIYGTDHFRDRYESAARANLRAAIQALA